MDSPDEDEKLGYEPEAATAPPLSTFRLESMILPALNGIIKASSWRKHSKLSSECKSLIEKFPTLSITIPFSGSDAEIVLSPLISAVSSSFSPKIVGPALNCLQKLISFGVIHGDSDSDGLLTGLIDAVCECASECEDDRTDLLVMKTLLSSVTSTSLGIHGGCLLKIVKTSHDLYSRSRSVVNQTTAKASMIQMLLVVFKRMESDPSAAADHPIVVPEDEEEHSSGGAVESTVLLDSTDRDVLDVKHWEISMYKTALEGRKGGEVVVGRDEDLGVRRIQSKTRNDAFSVFRALCRFSIVSPTNKDALEDPKQTAGKIVALELLKIMLENAGPLFRTSQSFLAAIKQYLCLSLLKNTTSPLTIVFELSCSIFTSLVSRFRHGLKAEIGVFFPILVLRVLENAAAQPNYFQQRMIVLQFLEKLLCVDSQILVDIFINYDCDVKSSNIFERMVNVLIKTAQGVPPAGVATITVLPFQDQSAMKLRAIRCLVEIMKSMGDWMNKQLRIDPDLLHYPKKSDEVVFEDNESGSDMSVAANGSEHRSDLGEGEELSLKVMHAYVDSFNFQDIEFDEAIRVILQGFRLPGEAQKIDRIMEKFAERYCTCNPKAFSSADTAYVLAYSIIMLNTDAHNPMVKGKMSADDFVRNNHGIDDGKDLAEDYMRSMYERILGNEIKMREDNQYIINFNRIPGLDSILNILIQRRAENYKSMATSDDDDVVVYRMQQQFKENARRSDYYPASTDHVVPLRFMIDVCWAPMLAAFSIPLDQSDDEVVISLCLDGFCAAIHVTAVMNMKTHRDAFVTSLAKFTSLHSSGDIKQKNIDVIKAIVRIAEKDGNYLQQPAWEHILMCVSLFERLRQSGEGGASPDASLFALSKKGAEQVEQYSSSTAVRRGSYDKHVGGIPSMLEQIEPSRMNQIFTTSSQSLNNEAVVGFVRALCKVSMEELHSSHPRVFSLAKIVEIAHCNMNRIRLVWSGIWRIISDFFVEIGCSENLSIAIFAMDSLRQLSMKFLEEREELDNYNFQNEFMNPFVIVIRESKSVEIRELIMRCISQIILTRVTHVKSGWKTVFMVLAAASHDEYKIIITLSMEIIEKIIRDYFPYIITTTETEIETSTTFADFVSCLVAFTDCRLNKDISLNAIGFLRFSAVKLAAEGELRRNGGKQLEYSHHHLQYFWFPLLVGLSGLSFDPRPEIRTNAVEILFETLRSHGHLFSLPLWERIFDSVLLPIFEHRPHESDHHHDCNGDDDVDDDDEYEEWVYDETCTLTLQLIVDVVVNFYDTANPLLKTVLALLTGFMRTPHRSLAIIGISAFIRLMSNAVPFFTDDKWVEVILSIKEIVAATLPDFYRILGPSPPSEPAAAAAASDEDLEKERSIANAKCHATIQLMLIQAMMDIYKMYNTRLSVQNTLLLFQALRPVATHACKINTDRNLRSKLQDPPPLLHLEKESYQICLTLLQTVAATTQGENPDQQVELQLVDLCREVLQVYLHHAKHEQLLLRLPPRSSNNAHWLIPLGSGKRKELTAREPLVISTLHSICELGESSVRNNLTTFFPLFADLISCNHGSSEIRAALGHTLDTCVGPVLLHSC